MSDFSFPVERKTGFLTSFDGLKLYRESLCRTDRPGAPLLGIVHGYGEHLGRYREVQARALTAGFEVHAFEYRGHGMSQGRRAHVNRFTDYLADLDVFVAHLRSDAGERPLFLMGHSLGGLIAARWLEERAPTGLDGAVLCSPFAGMSFEPPAWKRRFAHLATHVLPRLAVSNGLDIDQLTRDPDIRKATAGDPRYLRTTTPRWFCEVEAAQRALLSKAVDIETPLLLIIGEADPIASPRAAERFFGALTVEPRRFLSFPGMLHELFNEMDRQQVFDAVFGWLGERARRGQERRG